jgi:lysozyme
MRTLGIDVSHYQKNVAWESVARSDVKFAFTKATEGNAAVDAFFEANWRGIQDAGLFRGAYHFGRPGSDPETQATHFAAVVGPLGFRDLPPVLDLEVSDGRPAEAVVAWARAFVARAETLFGRKLIIYTGAFWRDQLGAAADPLFQERALWLAAYVLESKLLIPRPWSRWTLWQYSEGSFNRPSAVPGVGLCDQNWFDGGPAELDMLCRATMPAPEQPPAVPAGGGWPGGTSFVWPRTPAVNGGAVRAWQERMIARGFQVDADGVYGPESKRACMAFQRDRGLVPDGIVGPATWAATFGA